MPETRAPSSRTMPFVLQVDTAAIVGGSVKVPVGNVARRVHIFHVTAYLQALVSGTFGLELRDMADDTLIKDFSWAGSPGLHQENVDPAYVMEGQTSGFKIDVTGLGIGANRCTVTVWTRLEI